MYLLQQSKLISVTNKDLNNNLTELINNNNQINENISKEITILFKRLRRINSSNIYDFYQTKIKLFEMNEKQNNIKYNDSKTYNINYNNHYQLNKNNSLISDYNSYTINSFNLNKKTNDYNYKKYSSNTLNSMLNPSNNYTKIVKKDIGKILTIEINYIGAALSKGIIFPFKKTSNMRLKEKKNRLRSISNNSSYSEINN